MPRPSIASALLLLLFVAAVGRGGEPAPLRISWGVHNAPPYAIVSGGQLTAGVIHDFGVQTAKQMHTTAHFIAVPRARYEAQLHGGEIDMTCIVNPQWLATPDTLVWSKPLFDEVDVLVQRATDAPLRVNADLNGKRIGTILGYYYTTLNAQFTAGVAQRDDAADLDSNLQRLALGRIDVVVDANLPIYYWLLRNDRRRALRVAPLVISQHAVSCAISPRAGPGAQRIRATVNALLDKGVARDILAGYLAAD